MKQYDQEDKNSRIQRTRDRIDLVNRMEDEANEQDEEEQTGLQQKSSLEIGAPGDQYEQQADAVAKQIVSGDDARVEMNSSASNIQAEHEEGSMLMAKGESGGLHGTAQLQAKLNSSKGGGQSLNKNIRSDMGEKMGADLSGVKIHTDSNAHEMSEGINAKAFTHGQDIYFNQGNFDTGSAAGKELLAHELTHTVQQKEQLQRKIQRSVKFEIQTRNYIYAVKKQGKTPDASYNPDPKLLPRKFGTNSTAYDEKTPGASQETGPAYLSRGLMGEQPGDFVEVKKGPTVMEEAKEKISYVEAPPASIDVSLPAQFIVKIRVKGNIQDYMDNATAPKEKITNGIDNYLEKGKGQSNKKHDLAIVDVVDNATALGPTFSLKKYNPGTYEFQYYPEDFDSQPPVMGPVLPVETLSLDVHRNPEGQFMPGRKKWMVEKNTGADLAKGAQFIKAYKFKKPTSKSVIIGTDLLDGQLELIDDRVNTMDFNPNTFEFNYFDSDGVTPIDVHLDEYNTFQEGHVKLMKVGRMNQNDKKQEKGKEPVDMEPQYLELFEVPGSEKGVDALIGKPAVVINKLSKDNSLDPAMKDRIYMGTWKRKYYKPGDIIDGVVKDDAQNLQVHVDNDNLLQKGHIELLKQVPALKKDEDGSTIEIQSEHLGVLEFETPKWFRDWKEVSVLIQEAVDFTKAIDSAPDANAVVTANLQKKHKMDSPFIGTTTDVPKVKTWPAGYSTDHLKLMKQGNRELVVVVSDPYWTATIQGSESIELSEYHSLATDYEGAAMADFLKDDLTTPAFNIAFNAANDEIKAENKEIEARNQTATDKEPYKPELNENLYGNLKGFVELIYNYIYRAQIIDTVGENSKSTFRLMARTNFASMYKNLLSEPEKKMFERMLGDPNKQDDNPLFTTVLNSRIDGARKSNIPDWQANLQDAKTRLAGIPVTDTKSRAPVEAEVKTWSGKIKRVPATCQLTRATTLWYSGVGSTGTYFGPAIYSWLSNFKNNKDLLDGVNSGGLSDAMGGKTVATEVGDKDYMQAKFEIRGSNIKLPYAGYNPLGNGTFPNDLWLTYTKELFDRAMKRSSDTPDDLTTAKGDAAKTSLKD